MARRKQNPINDIKDMVGAFFGGSGSSQRSVAGYGSTADNRQRMIDRSQTSFPPSSYWSSERKSIAFGKTNLQFPEPQNIVNMPRQNAGYSDRYNTQGQPATSKGMIRSTNPLEDLMFNKDEIYVMPSYMEDFDKVGNDPDSSDYVSNYRGPKSIRQTNNIRAVAAGVKKFADATGKYYNKKVTVMRGPNDENKVPKSSRAQIIYVGGDTRFNEPNPWFAGVYNGLWGSSGTRTKPVSRFKEDRSEVKKIIKASSHEFKLNTNMHPMYDSYQTPSYWAGVAQHEYHHALGFNHPEGYEDLGQLNSIMSYANVRSGAKLLPADINAVQDVYKQIKKKRDVSKRAASAYKGVAKKRK